MDQAVIPPGQIPKTLRGKYYLEHKELEGHFIHQTECAWEFIGRLKGAEIFTWAQAEAWCNKFPREVKKVLVSRAIIKRQLTQKSTPHENENSRSDH